MRKVLRLALSALGALQEMAKKGAELPFPFTPPLPSLKELPMEGVALLKATLPTVEIFVDSALYPNRTLTPEFLDRLLTDRVPSKLREHNEPYALVFYLRNRRAETLKSEIENALAGLKEWRSVLPTSGVVIRSDVDANAAVVRFDKAAGQGTVTRGEVDEALEAWSGR